MIQWKRPGRRTRALFGLALAPPFFWAMVLLAMPTEWARCRLADQIASSAGQPVEVASVRVCVLGGVEARGLKIGPTGSGQGPWIEARTVKVDLSLAQMLLGVFRPTEVAISGLDVHAHRRADGSFNLGELFANEDPRDVGTGTAPAEDRHQIPIRLKVRDGRLRLTDDRSSSTLSLGNLEISGSWAEEATSIDQLTASLNGGYLEAAARVDRGVSDVKIEGELRARGVAVDSQMRLVGLLAPVLVGAGERLEGTLNLIVYGRGQGRTLESACSSMVGQGALRMDPVRLDGSPLLAQLIEAGGRPGPSAAVRLGSLRSDFVIKNRRIATENLTLDLAGLPLVLAGWTGFDGQIAYKLRSDRLVGRLPREARELLAEMPDLARELVDIRVEGSLDHAVVLVDGIPLSDDARSGPQRLDDRNRMRQLGRRLRDRLIR